MNLFGNSLLSRLMVGTLAFGAVAFGACTGTSTSMTCTSTGGATLTSTPAPPGTTFPQVATVYPITNTVSGMSGTITSVSVRLNGLSHTDPDDLDMLLVSPDGKAFVFWSDIGGLRNTFDQTQFGGTNVCRTQTATGGACSISNFTITVDDNGATRLPDGGTPAGRDTRVLVNNTTYQPANGGNDQETFSNTSPSFSAGVTLTLANFAQNTTSTTGIQIGGTGTFANIYNGSSNVNGDWKLYITVDGCCFTDGSGVTHNDVGSLTSWSLIVTTASNAAATTTTLSSNNNPSLLPNNNSVTFTATVTSGGNPVTLGAVSFFDDGVTSLGTNVPLNASGQASVTVTNLNERIHVISANYSGATGFASGSGTLQQTVNRATTITGNTFCNPGAIAIPATFTPNPAATPYPSNLFVTGLGGNISKVTLDLKGYSITAASDADVLLVGPGGQKFLPFSFIGGVTPVSNVNVTLDDDAASALPSTGGITSGTFRPRVYNTQGVSFPTPAPAGPHAAAAPIGTSTFANTFGGLVPNGTWRLFVSTHGGTNAVSNFSGGWCLTFTTTSDPGTVTTPSISPTPSALNQSTTVAALVTNASTSAPVNARGTVSFFENSTLLNGPIAVGSNGVASFLKSDFTQGAHFVDANYSGAPGFFNLSTGRTLHYVDAPTTNPSAGLFCNTSPVTFPNVLGASGSPYPTRITVDGMGGVVSNVFLRLNSLSHNFPKDMDIMLSGPNGNSLVVLSDVGGTAPLTTPVDLALENGAAITLPAASALSSGTFRPNDFFDGPDTWAPPAPTANVFSAPATSFGTAFSNSNPNGLWTLWTTNDGAGSVGGGSLAGGWCLGIATIQPQLTISKTHVGNFTQGQTGAQYTVTVGSSGPGSTVGTITVRDTVPTGLTVTGMSGSGWTCTVGTATCTTSAVLASGASLPPITVTVNVASNATSPQVNSVTVSQAAGGAAGATANDSTIINQLPDLTIAKTTSSSFTQGSTAAFSLTVTNSGAGPTSGNYTISDLMPAGLTVALPVTGSGWDCSASTTTAVSCVRSTVLNGTAAAPTVTVNVNIASNAPSSITNTATVSGGGETNTGNNSGSVTVNVSQPAQFLLTTLVNNLGAGTGTVSPATGLQNAGLVSVTATPGACSVFTGWTGATVTAGQVNLTGPLTLTATFSAPVAAPATKGTLQTIRGTPQRYRQAVAVLNTSGAPADISIILDTLGSGVSVFAPAAPAGSTTSCTGAAGRAFYTVSNVAAGAYGVVTFDFTGPSAAAITYNASAVVGAGPR